MVNAPVDADPDIVFARIGNDASADSLRARKVAVDSAVADLERFEFTVPGYTPDTMPLDRLIEYLEQLTVVLGEASELHLVGIEKSSTRPVLVMRHDVATRARARASEVRQGGGSARRRNAYDRIRHMVSEDGGAPASLAAPEGQILEFAMIDIGADQIVHAVRQPTTVQGELIRIGGRQENAQLLIQELSGNVIAGCTAPRAVATAMAHLLYRPVSVSGDARWHRSNIGKWEIESLHVQSFAELDADDHEAVVAKLQALNVAWPDDAMEQLAAMRRDAA
jgi:hypothetical protein